jgi:hypothetical protein
MTEPVAPLLAGWESFYVIVGSSSAALTGLMFVVISLISEKMPNQPSEIGIAAFATPTIVHLCAAFLVSAIASVPWHEVSSATLLIGVTGLAGVAYVLIVTWRARRVPTYKPVLEDWLWHTVFPLASYATFVVAATRPEARASSALFAIGAASMFLVFIGVHNAWDSVTWNTIRRTVEKTSSSG